jgi:hypothetical protein
VAHFQVYANDQARVSTAEYSLAAISQMAQKGSPAYSGAENGAAGKAKCFER